MIAYLSWSEVDCRNEKMIDRNVRKYLKKLCVDGRLISQRRLSQTEWFLANLARWLLYLELSLLEKEYTVYCYCCCYHCVQTYWKPAMQLKNIAASFCNKIVNSVGCTWCGCKTDLCDTQGRRWPRIQSVLWGKTRILARYWCVSQGTSATYRLFTRQHRTNN